MNTRSAANIVGVTPKQLRAFLRTRTDLAPAPQAGKQYDFSLEQVEIIKDEYWDTRQVRRTKEEWLDTDAPGMKLEDLANPTTREQFTALRRERAQRLDALLRNAGLSLGQMSEERLLANGRVLNLEETNA